MDLNLVEPKPKVLASTIRFRPPNPDKYGHEFKVSDFVVIARLEHSIPTSQSILHHCGIITEVDDCAGATAVEIQCHSCDGTHRMHESELDLLEDRTVLMLRDKAGVNNRPVSKAEADKRDFEDEIAILMHNEGFLRVAVEDRPVPFADPALPTPHWSKYVYGTIGQMGPFSLHAGRLLHVAHAIKAHLVEWHCFNLHKGWVALTLDDMDTLTFDMPTRAVFQSRANNGDSSYDEAKKVAADWLGSANKIDVEAICRGLKTLGFKVSDWDASQEIVTFRIWEPHNAHTTSNIFVEWAKANWLWLGRYSVTIGDSRDGQSSDEDDDFYQCRMIVNIRLDAGTVAEVEVEEESDVPF